MNSPKTKTLIVIAGPTAVGKTVAAIEVAKHFDTVVVSADSRQFFREMSIGTAKPSAEELAQAKHYFIDSHSITEPFSVGDFERECLMLLDDLFKKHDYVVLAGGSGLYIKAICEGFDDLPTADPAIREKLNLELEEEGLNYLQEKLKQADPVYYNQVDLGNPQRIIRALEVFESTGNPISYYRQATVNKRPFHIIKLALNMPRELLYRRINDRVDIMLQQGLLAEIASLLPYRQLNALNTVGYAEIFDYMDGTITLDKAVEMIKQNTRRFAKRQLTWFRKDQQFIWFDAGAPNLIEKLVEAVENVS
jgi:tRNA dimethylallyltransferase